MNNVEKHTKEFSGVDTFYHIKWLKVGFGAATQEHQDFIVNTRYSIFKIRINHLDDLSSLKEQIKEKLRDPDVKLQHSRAEIHQILRVRDFNSDHVHTLALTQWSDRYCIMQVDRQIKMKSVFIY
jgi:hypothetical protein